MLSRQPAADRLCMFIGFLFRLFLTFLSFGSLALLDGLLSLLFRFSWPYVLLGPSTSQPFFSFVTTTLLADSLGEFSGGGLAGVDIALLDARRTAEEGHRIAFMSRPPFLTPPNLLLSARSDILLHIFRPYIFAHCMFLVYSFWLYLRLRYFSLYPNSYSDTRSGWEHGQNMGGMATMAKGAETD